MSSLPVGTRVRVKESEGYSWMPPGSTGTVKRAWTDPYDLAPYYDIAWDELTISSGGWSRSHFEPIPETSLVALGDKYYDLAVALYDMATWQKNAEETAKKIDKLTKEIEEANYNLV